MPPRPRRQKGEGSVFRRADGRWSGSFEVDSPLGRRRKYVYAPTQRDCIARLKAARREYETAGGLIATVTVKDWLTRWLDDLEQDKAVRARTLESGYRSKLGHVTERIGQVRLDRLTVDHVKGVYRAMAAAGLARSTIVQTHRILTHAITDAYQSGRVGRNIMLLVPTPKVGKAAKKATHMTAAEVLRVLKALEGDRLASRWLFQITLGARQGEVLALGWEDVDLDEGRVLIRRKVERLAWRHGCGGSCGKNRAGSCPQRTGGGLLFDEPKSETSNRSLPLPPLLLLALKSRHERWLTEPRPDLSGRGDLAPHALVWGTEDGLPYDGKNDRAAWRALLARAKVDTSYGTHAARHGLATLMSSRGVPPKVIQGILGHADAALTMRVYAGFDDDATRRALEMAESAMREDPDA